MIEIDQSYLALLEAFRVLKPSGRLFVSDSVSDPECMRLLPEAERRQWYEKKFGSRRVDYREYLTSIGFEVMSYQETGQFAVKEGRLEDMGTRRGFEMQCLTFRVEAHKPQVGS